MDGVGKESYIVCDVLNELRNERMTQWMTSWPAVDLNSDFIKGASFCRRTFRGLWPISLWSRSFLRKIIIFFKSFLTSVLKLMEKSICVFTHMLYSGCRLEYPRQRKFGSSKKFYLWALLNNIFNSTYELLFNLWASLNYIFIHF